LAAKGFTSKTEKTTLLGLKYPKDFLIRDYLSFLGGLAIPQKGIANVYLD